MLPADFKEANIKFNKPKDMTDEECLPIRVFRGHRSGRPVIISKWQPSKEDIEAINRGEGIYLEVVGTGLTPVSLYTENPFTINPQSN